MTTIPAGKRTISNMRTRLGSFSFSDAKHDASGRHEWQDAKRTAKPRAKCTRSPRPPRTFELARGVPENTCFFYSVGPLTCLHRCSDVCLPDVSLASTLWYLYTICMLSRTTNIYSARTMRLRRVIPRYIVERNERPNNSATINGLFASAFVTLVSFLLSTNYPLPRNRAVITSNESLH